MNELTIYRRYFTASDCYRSGTKQKTTGVQVHSTGANNPWLRRYVGPDDGRLGKNQYNNHSNQPGSDVCASAYIGRMADGTIAVYQSLPFDMRCWLSGSGSNGNANKLGYIGYEICEDGLTDEQYFRDVMRVAVLFTAHLCDLIGRMPDELTAPGRYVVMDHAELHAAGLASNHGDIRHWLRRYGMDMNDFRKEVRQAMLEGVSVTYVDTANDNPQTLPVLRMGSTGEKVRMLQQLLQDNGQAVEADGVFGPSTRAALKVYQQANKLTVDGICGAVTWAALMTKAPEEKEDEEPVETEPQEQQQTWREIVEQLRSALAESKELNARMGQMIEKMNDIIKEGE